MQIRGVVLDTEGQQLGNVHEVLDRLLRLGQL
jgi:hypothetical protein